MRSGAAILGVALALGSAHAVAQDADLGALRLADETPAPVAAGSDWRRFVEGAAGRGAGRDGQSRDTRRLSVDLQYDHALSADWRAFLADRLDLAEPPLRVGEQAVNTLKEAYLSWQARPDLLFDLGRINVRNGVAMGYNPTDHFRVGALRAVVSIDPASLRENRQGSVMLRAQRLWDGGALSALFSPDLGHAPASEGLSLDPGATNPRPRWLLNLSQRLGDGLTPQFLLYQESTRDPQFGFNLTHLLGKATVTYLEWSGGRGTSLLDRALAPPDGREAGIWRNRLATGLTHTTADKLSLTAEFHYNGGGLDEDAWRALRHGAPIAYGRYRAWLQYAQELPTRRALFLHAVWQDALLHHLDLSAIHHVDLTDASRRSWVEARYHADPFEYSVQWQHNRGAPLSTFGGMPEARSWQLALRRYF